MDIKLKKILIRNWKVIDELSIDLEGKNADIYGYNETGKTTIYDAFIWLLFGKDSQGQTDFEIKPVRENKETGLREVQHNLQSIVSAVLEVDGRDVEFTKMYQEKWTKKRGSEAPEFDGHETSCWVNEEPVKIGEYQLKIGKIVDEKIFRRITNADAFLGMKKTEIRAALVEMAGNVDPLQVAGQDQVLVNLVKLMQDRQQDELVLIKIAKQGIKQCNDEIDGIPARIDEVKRSIPPYQDYELVRAELNQRTNELDLLTRKLAVEGAPGVQAKLNELHAKKRELTDKISKAAMDLYRAKDDEISRLNSDLLVEQLALQREEANLLRIPEDSVLLAEIDQHRKKYTELVALHAQAKQMEYVGLSDKDMTCPTCNQSFPQDKIQELNDASMARFTEERKTKLAALVESINAEAAAAKAIREGIASNGNLRELVSAAIQTHKNKITEIAARIKNLNEIKNAAKVAYDNSSVNDPTIAEIDLKIKELEESNHGLAEEKAEIMEQMDNLKGRIDALKETLNNSNLIAKGNERIAELQERNRELGILAAKQEKIRDACERFMRLKAEALTDGINGLFSYVTWRLFDVQVNGGVVDDCTPMVNGVNLYTNGSRSQRIRAGLDIIKTLQKSSGVRAPVFIDNAESANWLIDLDCQVIRLIVPDVQKKPAELTDEERKLKVEVEE